MNLEGSFFLHAGGHKTGTTSLQNFFFQNSKMLRDFGVHWLQSGLRANVSNSWGQHELAWALRDGDAKSLWKEVADEVSQIPPGGSALVSSEDFSLLRNPQKFLPVKDAISALRIRPIYFIRQQDQLLEAIYKYHVKSLGEFDSILQFSKKVVHRLDHAGFIDCLSSAFGKNNIILEIYGSNAMEKNIYTTFLDAIGIPDHSKFKFPEVPLNRGISDTGLEIMLAENRRHSGNPEKLKQVRDSILPSVMVEPWTQHHVLSPSERQDILLKFESGNRRIARDFFDRSELF